MAMAIRVVGNEESKGSKAATMTTTAAAVTAKAAGKDSNQLKAAADKKSYQV